MSMHKNLEKLAIFGGKPKFDETLHVGRPNIGNRERFLDRLNDILDRKWWDRVTIKITKVALVSGIIGGITWFIYKKHTINDID